MNLKKKRFARLRSPAASEEKLLVRKTLETNYKKTKKTREKYSRTRFHLPAVVGYLIAFKKERKTRKKK